MVWRSGARPSASQLPSFACQLASFDALRSASSTYLPAITHNGVDIADAGTRCSAALMHLANHPGCRHQGQAKREHGHRSPFGFGPCFPVVKKIEHRKPVCGTPGYHYGYSSPNRGWHRYGNEPTSPCALAKSGHLASPGILHVLQGLMLRPAVARDTE